MVTQCVLYAPKITWLLDKNPLPEFSVALNSGWVVLPLQTNLSKAVEEGQHW